ncbi:MAG: hypothetical protein D6718_10020 [Acidobacteria bacterium]|nr:MAG: hypothetical protein D6718_10020 [Acidobacteriota bacterium]
MPIRTTTRVQRHAVRIVPVIGVACGLLLAGSSAHAAGVPGAAPELLAPEGAVRRPRDPIRIRVPGLAEQQAGRLILELDALDVTDVVEFDAERDLLAFEPVEPLEWGVHELRLVERSAGGESIERGSWTFEVRHSARLREAEVAAAAELSGFGRIASGGPDDPGPASGSEGVLHATGTIADGSWRLSSEAELVHHSEAELLPRGHGHVDLGDFLLRGEAGRWWLAVGHHAPAPNSLVASDLRRRGVSAGYGQPDDPVFAAAFALRTQEIAGFAGGLGAGDPGDRVAGGAVRARPLASAPEALVLSATWLAGRDPGQFGEGVGGDTATHAKGRAASLALEGTVVDQRLQYGAEYARTRWDADGDGTGEPRRDRAFAARVEYEVLGGRPVGEEPASLRVGLERRRLGTFFRSVGNPSGAADQDLLRATAAFSRAGFDVQADFARETDNVNGLTPLPRVRSLQGSLSLTFAPRPERDPESGTPWYGEPTWSLSWVGLDQDVVLSGAGLVQGALRRMRVLSVSADFSYPMWNWSLGHTIGREAGYGDEPPGTDDATTELSFHVVGRDKVTVGLSALHSRTRDRERAAVLRNGTITLDADFALGAGVQAALGTSWNRERASDAPSARSTLDTTGLLRWVIGEARGRRPAVALSLEAQRHRLRDSSDPESSAVTHRVLLRLALRWGAD